MRSPGMNSVCLWNALGSVVLSKSLRNEPLHTSMQIPFFSSSCPHPHCFSHIVWHVLLRLPVPLRPSHQHLSTTISTLVSSAGCPNRSNLRFTQSFCSVEGLLTIKLSSLLSSLATAVYCSTLKKKVSQRFLFSILWSQIPPEFMDLGTKPIL